jgi:MOSC domain-containing protein YiiM
MKIVSVNVGQPRPIRWKGLSFETSIFKHPVSGRVMLRKTKFDGDRQADLTVHGGPNKAVYAYPSEHYEYWAKHLAGHDLPWGSFGENLTTEGMLETQVSVGDRYRIGSAIVRVTTPRLPCFKLAAKFQREQLIEEFLNAGYSGFYFSVVEEGEMTAGDSVQFVGSEAVTLTIAEAYSLYGPKSQDVALLRRATQVQAFPESWRQRFQARLEELTNVSAD